MTWCNGTSRAGRDLGPAAQIREKDQRETWNECLFYKKRCEHHREVLPSQKDVRQLRKGC